MTAHRLSRRPPPPPSNRIAILLHFRHTQSPLNSTASHSDRYRRPSAPRPAAFRYTRASMEPRSRPYASTPITRSRQHKTLPSGPADAVLLVAAGKAIFGWPSIHYCPSGLKNFPIQAIAAQRTANSLHKRRHPRTARA
jgi:hypothetical protein